VGHSTFDLPEPDDALSYFLHQLLLRLFRFVITLSLAMLPPRENSEDRRPRLAGTCWRLPLGLNAFIRRGLLAAPHVSYEHS
jgi:hypothetical protein